MTSDDTGTLAQIRAELARVTYKPGWEFHAALVQGAADASLIEVTIDAALPDPAMPNRMRPVQQTSYLPPQFPPEQVLDWLRSIVGYLEIGQRDEWFLVDGERIYDPHQEGTA